jgi:deoxyribonuclease V
MIACIDVGYQEKSALAACITISDWKDSAPVTSHTVEIQNVEAYVPGLFYKRELPCIEAVLKDLGAKPDVLVIDGYVWLDAQGKKGLGAHLFELSNSTIPVIGVAKTPFATATNAIEVYRGQSSRPLWVTAIGTSEIDAAKSVESMHGSYRIPTILTLVDRLSKGSSGTFQQSKETS